MQATRMTGQARLHSTPPEHAASDNDLLHLHEEGHQDGVAQDSIANGHIPASDGEAAHDKYHHGKGQEKKERDSPEIVSSIKSRSLHGGPYSSRLTIHVSCSPQPHLQHPRPLFVHSSTSIARIFYPLSRTSFVQRRRVVIVPFTASISFTVLSTAPIPCLLDRPSHRKSSQTRASSLDHCFHLCSTSDLV